MYFTTTASLIKSHQFKFFSLPFQILRNPKYLGGKKITPKPQQTKQTWKKTSPRNIQKARDLNLSAKIYRK